MSLSPALPCPILQRTVWAEGLITLQLQAPAFAFEPGQFVNLALDVAGERVRRAYSLANAPGSPPEFYLSEVAGGALTPHLFRLNEGDPLWLEPNAQGFFTLRWLPEHVRELWLVATGTGLGPFISLLRSETVFSRFERVVVVHGARQHDHLGYRAELLGLQHAHANMSYLSSVTREPATPGVFRGRLPALFADGSFERAAQLELDPEHTHLMLCGNPDMIRDVSSVLATRGLRKHRQRQPGHITSENYW